jgi:transposase
MSRVVDYNPEQAYLLPPDAKQVLGADHLCFFVHEVVERLDLRRFLEVYSEEGGRLYHPSMPTGLDLARAVLTQTRKGWGTIPKMIGAPEARH